MIHNSPVPSYLKRGGSEVPYTSRKKERLRMTKSEGFAMKKRGGGETPRPDESM